MVESVALVTGASSGIGRATALRLAKDFSRIALIARDADKLRQVATQIEADGAKALTIELDLGNPTAARTAIERTLAVFGRIDALLNIAGAVPGLDVFQMTDEQWDAGMALKFHGARRLALRAWEALKKTNGSVVFMSGNSAVFAKAPYAAVGSINAAIVALAKAFADRGLKDGVQVNSILPGPVMTDRRKSYLAHWAPIHNVSVEDATQAFLIQSGIARYGRPEEIASVAAFLASEEASYITGADILVDGGYTAV